MKTGLAGSGAGSVLAVWLLDKIGCHLSPVEAAAVASGVVGGVSYIIHHGGLKGLWKAITEGKP